MKVNEIQPGFRCNLENSFDITREIKLTILVSGSSTYDTCCFGVDIAEKLSDENYMIFYNQMASPDQEIILNTDNQEIAYMISLAKLPQHIFKLIFTINVDGNGTMRQVDNLKVNLSQGDMAFQLNMRGTDFKEEKAVIAIELYKKEVWRLATVGKGFNGGLSALLANYGGVEEIPEEKVSLEKPAYSKWAGINQIEIADKDEFGNALGSKYDLIEDGAFNGEVIYILGLYKCPLDKPIEALSKKGFKVIVDHRAPKVNDFIKKLSGASQFWMISNSFKRLKTVHIEAIREYYDQGHGVYIWGDNFPYYADANQLMKLLFNTCMTGNSLGNQVVPLCEEGNQVGVIPNHLISTGIVNVYEGITIANIEMTQELHPLIYGSNSKVVAAYYDCDGKRAIMDGGFTRLYCNWDSAGTDRYIVNAAAWLVNLERF